MRIPTSADNNDRVVYSPPTQHVLQTMHALRHIMQKLMGSDWHDSAIVAELHDAGIPDLVPGLRQLPTGDLRADMGAAARAD